MDIKCSDGIKKCRTYQQTAIPDLVKDLKDLPLDRRPSKIYWKVIVDGAKESGLPEEYQKFLNSIPHNGYEGEISINLNLDKVDE